MDTIRIWEAFICEWYISFTLWKGLKDQIDKFTSDLQHNIWVFHCEQKLHQSFTICNLGIRGSNALTDIVLYVPTTNFYVCVPRRNDFLQFLQNTVFFLQFSGDAITFL